MNMKEVREIAKTFDLKTARMSKSAIIQQIQLAEGNVDCFSKIEEINCQELDCLWRDDCSAEASKA